MDSFTVYTIVDLSLRGILIKPLFIIWLVGLCLVRRRGDKARFGFTYMNLAYPFWIISLTLIVVADALAIIRATIEDNLEFDFYGSTSDRNTDNLLYNIIVRLSNVATVMECITDILVLLCTVELGNGFLYCLEHTRTALQKALRYTALGLSLVLFALCLAQVGVYSASYSKYFDYQNSLVYDYDSSGYDYSSSSSVPFDEAGFEKGLKDGKNLGVAFDMIIFVASVGMVAYASYVLHRVISMPAYRNSAVLLLVVTLLQLLRYCWWIAVDAMWGIPEIPAPYQTYDVADPILNDWPMFVALVLIFVIGLRKHTGLWSTAQPWTGNTVVISQPAWQQPPPPGAVVYPAQHGVVYMAPAPTEYAPMHSGYQMGQTPMPIQPLQTGTGELEQPGYAHEVKAN